ncbi:transposase [Sphingobium sp. Ant17]|nr:transposase [Sphingobium sp. Ant17]
MITDKIETLLANKGYDADALREELENAEVEIVILAKSNRREPIPQDRENYRWRNLVERLFNKLNDWRRIATRYDKTKNFNLGFVSLVAVLQWILFVHET